MAQLQKDHPVLFQLTGLQDAMVEAAAYGYGIVPAILTDTQTKAWRKALSTSWDDSGMTLSEKIHGAGVKMRESIVSTIRTQMRRNATWISMSRELYDGYNSGKAVTVQQALPKYLQAVRNAYNSPQIVLESRKAMRNIERLSKNGAPTKALKAAYKQLIETAQMGTEEALNKACWVAMQEKSRYIADRIARTETARAWADGFLADIMQDDDVVAVKWKLSSRHPVFDVCDMYSKANMYNLGAGVYPKDTMPPLPAHPHCLCRYVKVYAGDVDLKKQKNCIRSEGDKWLSNLSDDHRRKVLGLQGNEAFKNGSDWRKYMRGWTAPASVQSRIASLMEKNLFPPTDTFIASLAQKYGMPYTKGKKGEERFYSDKGKPIYPPNDGAVGTPKTITLKAGSVIVDRYGRETGQYLSPMGTPYEKRSLPRGSKEREYHIYQVIKDIGNVQEAEIGAWFGQPGGGVQYKLPKRIVELGGYLKEVKQ